MINKKALIIGGLGMVGRQLTKLCEQFYNEVCVVDINATDVVTKKGKVSLVLKDMTKQSHVEIIKDYDHIYHVAGIKGSPIRAKERPADYLSMLQFDTNIIQAVGKYKPDWFLYTSSVGVYPPSEFYKEDEVWDRVPSSNDKIPAYIKRMGELSCEAVSITDDYKNISIVRPANIYGPFDNFGDESTVIASLIKKGYNDDVINVWGDGTPIRDFIYSKDVARGMLHMVQNRINDTINLGSGEEVRISDIANIVGDYFGKFVRYDKTKPNGDLRRQMDTTKMNDCGFKRKYTLKQGINDTINWYTENLK
jgi:GDP-L-fucose synthase